MWLIFGVGIIETRALVMRDVIAYLCTVWDSCVQSKTKLHKTFKHCLEQLRGFRSFSCFVTCVPDCSFANVNTVVVFP